MGFNMNVGWRGQFANILPFGLFISSSVYECLDVRCICGDMHEEVLDSQKYFFPFVF